MRLHLHPITLAPRATAAGSRRKGVVLLVVLALLGLFSVVAVSFVFFSDQETAASRLNVDSEKRGRPDPDVLLSFILNQLILDTRDAQSGLRGHGLLRNVYGRGGNQPFNGTGKLHTKDMSDATQAPWNNYYFLNYTGGYNPNNVTLSNDPTHLMLDPDALPVHTANPTDNELDFFGNLNPPYTYPDYNAPWLGAIVSRATIGGQAHPNVVIARSFVRVGVDGGGGFFNPYDTPANAGFWTDSDSAFNSLPAAQQVIEKTRRRLIVVRPRPADHGGLFPSPADQGGDVKNLPPGTVVLLPNGQVWSGNDSYWVDPNFPVQVGPDGKRYKVLVAFFIMDLDGKLNLNLHMNNMGQGGHVSNQGHGPWEIGPPPASGAGISEFSLFGSNYPLLFFGQQNGMKLGRYYDPKAPNELPLPGKYNTPPGTPPQAIASPPYLAASQPGFGGPAHAQVDWNGLNSSGNRTDFITLARKNDTANQKNWYTSPYYPNDGYENGTISNEPMYGVQGDWRFHPFLASGLRPSTLPTSLLQYAHYGDHRISPGSLDLLYRMRDTGTDALTSDLFRIFPQPPNLNPFAYNGPANRLRWMVTTDSADAAAYGFVPRKGSPEEEMTGAVPNQIGLSKGVALKSISKDRTLPAQFQQPPANPHGNLFWDAGLDMHPITGQPLTPPFVPVFTGQRFDILNKGFQYNYPPPDPMTYRIDLNNAGIKLQFVNAQVERQQLAKQLYLMLVETAGIKYPSGNYLDMTRDPELAGTSLDPTVEKALKQLAQVAVNIVDYLDPDDYSTPFNWGSVWGWSTNSPLARTMFTTAYGSADARWWVHGTEAPRAVINETYAEYKKTGPTEFEIKVWVELFNPIQNADPSLPPENGAARLQIPESIGGAMDQYGAYQLVLSQGPNSFVVDDPRGDPDPAKINTTPGGAGMPTILKSWAGSASDTLTLGPNDKHFKKTPVPGTNHAGFLFVGPESLPGSDPMRPNPDFTSNLLKYKENGTGAQPTNKLTVILRRLACPHFPEDANPLSPTYNPLITVDYMADLGFANGDEFQDNDAMDATTVPKRVSVGRMQPLAGNTSLRMKQTPDSDAAAGGIQPLMNQPQTTFLRHNSIELDAANADNTVVQDPFPGGGQQTLHVPFDWLIHLDRPLISPLELLNVSCVRPSELTQHFMLDEDNDKQLQPEERFRHLELYDPASAIGTVAWLPRKAFAAGRPPQLYRLLDLLECQPISQWNNPQPVRPGKMNLNTIYELELFLALADMPSGNPLQTQAANVWTNLRNSRDGNSWAAGSPRPLEGRPHTDPAGNKPFWGSSVHELQALGGVNPFSTAHNGLEMTLLRTQTAGTSAQPILGFTQGSDGDNSDHPHDRYLLLNKIANNVTTRSNCFAVWATVGFFEVTNLSPTTSLDQVNTGTQTFQLQAVNGTLRPRTSTQAGDYLVVDSGINQETVEVLGFSGSTVQAQFTKPHAAGFLVQPALKDEIGRADGRHRRHRFFAIVDRTPLVYWVAEMDNFMQQNNLGSFDVAKTMIATPNDGSSSPGYPLLGGQRFDPRREYSISKINITAVPPNLVRPMPSTVLYWNIIE